MTKSLVDHRLLYRLKCGELKGIEFQHFFEQILARADTTFTAVKPMGPAGDWKCDGYSAATKTVYQCYAPDILTATKTCDKIHADFAGAKSYWGHQMKCWLFVWNAQALPPQVVSLFETLRREHPDVEIDHLGRDKMWDAVVSKLAPEVLNEILGEVSSPSEAVEAHLRAAKRGLYGKDDGRIRDLCLEVLALTEGDEALRLNRVEAHEILAILALNNRDTREARHQLQEMGTLLADDVKAAVCANYHRHLGLLSMLEEKDETAEAEFSAVLAVQPHASQDTADEEKLRALQCMTKADLVLNWCRHDQAARGEVAGKEILAFVKVNPEALGGQLICHAVDALVIASALKRSARRPVLLRKRKGICLRKEHHLETGCYRQARTFLAQRHKATALPTSEGTR